MLDSVQTLSWTAHGFEKGVYLHNMTSTENDTAINTDKDLMADFFLHINTFNLAMMYVCSPFGDVYIYSTYLC